MSTQPHKLASKLKHIRVVELDYSQAEMAKALQVDERDVAQSESGALEPPLLVLLNYARRVGISTDILIDDAREIRPNAGKW